MIVTPDEDDDDNGVNDSADDDDYTPALVVVKPTPGMVQAWVGQKVTYPTPP